MSAMKADFLLEFTSASIYQRINLLHDNLFKEILINSFEYLSSEQKIKVYGFVIMPNHIHILWQLNSDYPRAQSQGAFFKYTSHQFLVYLQNDYRLKLFEVFKHDRTHQFWEEAYIKTCFTRSYTLQKLAYIHNNPCQAHWQLADLPHVYPWSSASFYELGDKKFRWLVHIDE
jgi:REP element-mobilizing transposase RayT